jgi:arylformamidase
MTIIDISRTLWPDVATWPGDSRFSLTTMLDRDQGHSVNLTTITMSAHTGSHVDAPRHYTDDGVTIERLDLRPFWGLAQVVTIHKAPGPLFPQDFADYDLSQAPRLLVHTDASSFDPTLFPHNILYPSPALANYLGSLGIILFGSDVRNGLAIAALEQYSLTTVLFPAAVGVACFVFVAMVAYRRAQLAL